MVKQKPKIVPIGRIEFEAKLREKLPPETIQLVMFAYRLSKYGHMGQKRDSGLRYFEHPKRVALILMDELGIYNSDDIMAALLHDIEEDSFILEEQDIVRNFGEKVLEIVKILTREEPEERKAYIRKIRKAEKTARIIKLSDRLDNLRELTWCTYEKQQRIVQETMLYFLPLARRTNYYLYRKIQEICQLYQNRI